MAETVMQLINNCGFPIAMCVMMGYYIKTTQDKNNEVMNELKASIDALIAVVRDHDKE